MEATSKPTEYKKRSRPRIIRYTPCKIDKDITEYKRIMVLLFYPFRNELIDLWDCQKYIKIYDNNEEKIINIRKLYEANIDIDHVIEQLKELFVLEDNIQDQRTELAQCKTVENMFDFSNNDDVMLSHHNVNKLLRCQKAVYCFKKRRIL